MASTPGYELLIAAGSLLTGTAILATDAEPSNSDIDEFLIANQDALERARVALQQDCEVPLEYDAAFFEKHLDNRSSLGNLARSFALDLDAAVRLGELARAVDIGLNMFDLANAVRRGGLLIDLLLAVAIEGIAVDRIRGFRRRLETDDATRLANGLLQRDAAREPFDDIVARDRKWNELVGSPDDDRDFLNMEWLDDDEDEIDEETKQAIMELMQLYAEMPDDQLHAIQREGDDRSVAMMRLLAIESALLAFHAKIGVYPADLSSLAPVWIVAIPSDPFTGAAFKYRETATGFVVYSPGPTREDSGGNFGSWFSIQSGQADLSVDMYDYEDAGCVVNARPTLVSRFVAFLSSMFRCSLRGNTDSDCQPSAKGSLADLTVGEDNTLDAILVESGWLRRCVKLLAPAETMIEYNGRGIGYESVLVDGGVALRPTSWWWFIPRFDFTIETQNGALPVSLEVRVWPWLCIRKFRLIVANKCVYSEGRW